jgi:crotonobetainyl-CoA:carnitine CoA-transferase CaiB-like acyl-CoA transferase
MTNQHPLIAPYESFRTRDGYVNICVGNNSLWGTFCKVLGLEIYENDERFGTNPKRVENRPALIEVIEERTTKMSSQTLREKLDAAGIPNGPIWRVEEAVTSHQAIAREMVQEMEHPSVGRIKVTGIPVKLDRSPGDVRTPPPMLGQHTDEVLNELLGLGPEEILELRNEGVV